MIEADDDWAVAAAIANAQLVLYEREGRDRGWWDQMRDCYHRDGEIRVSWFQGNPAEFVKGSQRMAAHGDQTLHRLSPPAVYLGSGRALVTMGAAIDSRLVVHGVEADLVVYGRFLFRTQQRSGRWRISRMDFVYQRDTLTPALPGAQIRFDPGALGLLRPSYRMEAYVFGERGYTIDQQLPGDDRPGLVSALYRDAFTWAGLKPPGPGHTQGGTPPAHSAPDDHRRPAGLGVVPAARGPGNGHEASSRGDSGGYTRGSR